MLDDGTAIANASTSAKGCVVADGGVVWIPAHGVCVEGPGALVEGPGANLMLQSQNLSVSSKWDPEGSGPPANPVATANTAEVLAPDGTQTATKVVFGATASDQYSRMVGTLGANPAASTVYSMSFWARGTGAQTFYAGIDGVSAGPNAGSSALSLTTNWTRFSMQWTSADGESFIIPYIGSDTRPGHGNSTPMAAQTVYLWGVQFEASSYATSLMPTTTAVASRVIDALSIPNRVLSSSLFCMGATVHPNAWVDGSTHVIVAAGAGLGSSTQTLWWQSDGKIAVDVIDGAFGDLFYNSSSAPGAGPHHIVACRTGPTAFSVTMDGLPLPGAVGGSAVPFTQPATMFIGSDGSGTRPVNGWIYDACVDDKPC